MTARRALPATLSLLLFLLLLAPSASAHFHRGLVFDTMLVQVKQDDARSATVTVQFNLRNPGPGNFTGDVYLAFPAGATARQGRLGNEALTEATGPFLRLPLPPGRASLAPGEAMDGHLSYRVTVAEGARLVVDVPTLYAVERMRMEGHPAEGYQATGIGLALDAERAVPAANDPGTTPRVTQVAFDPEEGVPKLAWLVAGALLLLAGAAYWDYRRRRNGA